MDHICLLFDFGAATVLLFMPSSRLITRLTDLFIIPVKMILPSIGG
jgi:hypothetical protein